MVMTLERARQLVLAGNKPQPTPIRGGGGNVAGGGGPTPTPDTGGGGTYDPNGGDNTTDLTGGSLDATATATPGSTAGLEAPAAGGISGPDFSGDSGLSASGSVPPGYEPLEGYPGYFYNSDLKSVGVIQKEGQQGPIDQKTGLRGPSFTWRKLTKTEQTAFVAQVKTDQANGGPDTTGGISGLADSGAPTISNQISRDRLTFEEDQAKKAEADKTAATAATAAQQKVTNELNARNSDESIINARNGSAQSLLDFLKTYADMRYKQAQDPWQYGAYLNNLAQVAPGTGNPVQNMIFNGVKIAPTADPYEAEIQKLIGYVQKQIDGTPTLTDAEAARRALENKDTHDAAALFLSQKPEDLARMFGGNTGAPAAAEAGPPAGAPEAAPAPQPYGGLTGAFADQTANATDAEKSALAALASQGPDAINAANAQAAAANMPADQQHAHGGNMTTDGPAILVDVRTGQPKALMGEAGPERLKITPMQHAVMHSKGMNLPHAHADTQIGAMAQQANPGARPFATGGTVTSGWDTLAQQVQERQQPAAAPAPIGGGGNVAGGGQAGPDAAQQESESGLRALAGFENPDQVQQVLAAQNAAPAAAPASADPYVAPITKYAQSPLSHEAMMLATHGLESQTPVDINPTSGARGPYQLLGHTDITPADAMDPEKSTAYVSNDYNLAAEKVQREDPGLYERDPARAVALTVYYAEKPGVMYDEERYRKLYGALPKFATGGAITIGTDAATPTGPTAALAAPAAPPTAMPQATPAATATAPTTPVAPKPAQSQIGALATPQSEAGAPENQITAIKPTIAGLATPAIATNVDTATAAATKTAVPGMAQLASGAAGNAGGGVATGATDTPPVDPSIGWNNPMPQNTPFQTNPNAISTRWTRAQYQYIMIAAGKYQGMTQQQRLDQLGRDWDADKYLVAAAQSDHDKAYQSGLAQWQAKEFDHQRALQKYQQDKAAYDAAHKTAPGDQPPGVQPPDVQAKTLANSLRNLSYTPPELLTYLDAGKEPPPGVLTDDFLRQVPPSIKVLIQSVLKSFGTNLDDYEQSRKTFSIPGVNLTAAAGAR